MDLAKGLSKQKEELETNVWGQSKKGFYGRDKKRDDATSSDEEDDEDEYQEALRLQKVRAKKLMSLVRQEPAEEGSRSEQQAASSSDEDSVDYSKKGKKLGDLLFASEAANQPESNLKELLAEVKGKSLRQQVLAREVPELGGLLADLEYSLDTLMNQLKPLLADPQLKRENRPLATFVELKYNLLLSYCQYITFYLLMRQQATSEQVRDHPVLFKISTLKTTLDGLQSLDDKLEIVLQKKLKGLPLLSAKKETPA